MNLFAVRNYFSVLTSETLIKKFKLKKNIAIISGKSKNYYMEIKNHLDKELWTSIVWEDSSKYNIVNYLNFYSLKKFIKEKEIEYQMLFNKMNIQKIFMIGKSFVDQNIIVNLAFNNKIEINYYEEGMNFYLKTKNENNSLFKRLYKRFVMSFLKEKSYVYNRLDYKSCNGKIYSLINNPNFYNYKLILPNFPEIYKLQLKEIKYIFFSRPLSEDKLISERNEIKIIKKLLDIIPFDEKIYIKFHPRESIKKIKKINSIFEKKGRKLYEIKYKIPGEILLNHLSNNVKIFGYDGNIIFYASTIFDLKVISLLKICSKFGNKKYFFNLKEEMKDYSKNIEFI